MNVNPADTQVTALNISAEFELLFCCARTHLDPATIQRVQDLLNKNINFSELLFIAAEHRVKPLLHHNLSKYAGDAMPQSDWEKLKIECRKISLHNMFLMNELLDVSEKLEKHKIHAISFKGPVLATTYGDLSLRQIKDLDLLIGEADFQRTVDLLIDQGYEPIVQVPWETHLLSPIKSLTGSHSLDLHQDIAPKHLSCFTDSKMLWDYVEPYSTQGRTVYTFTPEMQLFILCLNGTKEGWFRLKRLCDVAELVRAHPNMDWQHILEISNRFGSRRLVLLGLLLSQNLLGVALPDTIEQKIQSDRVVKNLGVEVQNRIVSSRSTEEPGEVERTLFHISTRERWRDKVRCFIGLLAFSGWLNITENDREFIDLPLPLFFLYFFIRPLRVLAKYRRSQA